MFHQFSLNKIIPVSSNVGSTHLGVRSMMWEWTRFMANMQFHKDAHTCTLTHSHTRTHTHMTDMWNIFRYHLSIVIIILIFFSLESVHCHWMTPLATSSNLFSSSFVYRLWLILIYGRNIRTEFPQRFAIWLSCVLVDGILFIRDDEWELERDGRGRGSSNQRFETSHFGWFLILIGIFCRS